MNLANLDKTQCKLILKTSQGFPAQSPPSKARVVSKDGRKVVEPSKAGHAISDHLRGASAVSFKTKFCSMDDMADALLAVLKTSDGQRALQKLQPGNRATLSVTIPPAFPIQAHVDGIGPVTFNTNDLRNAGVNLITCVAILEGRLRASEMHLHLHTFYPKLGPSDVEQLLDAKTAP